MRAVSRAPQRISFELEVGRKPIAGALHELDGRVRPFSGWLELIALVEEVQSGCAPGGRVDRDYDRGETR
jgi:hypothetical protein